MELPFTQVSWTEATTRCPGSLRTSLPNPQPLLARQGWQVPVPMTASLREIAVLHPPGPLMWSRLAPELGSSLSLGETSSIRISMSAQGRSYTMCQRQLWYLVPERHPGDQPLLSQYDGHALRAPWLKAPKSATSTSGWRELSRAQTGIAAAVRITIGPPMQ